MTGKKLLIFDLDGTIINSSRDLTAAVNKMREKYGCNPLSPETVTGFIGNGTDRLIERSIAGTGIDFQEAKEYYSAYYAENYCVYTTMYNDVENSLKYLRESGHILAVLTNKQIVSTVLILKSHGIKKLFHSILGDGSGFPLKPEPEAILSLTAEYDIPPEDTYMIGDHYTDILAAENSGVHSVYLTYGLGETRGAVPDMVFDSFSELAEFI